MGIYSQNIQSLFKNLQTIDADFVIDFRVSSKFSGFYLRFSPNAYAYINPKIHKETFISIEMEQRLISLNLKHGQFNTISNNVTEILDTLTPRDLYFLARDLFSKQNGKFYLRDYQTDDFSRHEIQGPMWFKLEMEGVD